MKNKMLVVALSALALYACDKEDSETEDQGNTGLLVEQAWKFESAGFDLASDGTIDLDISSQLPPCLTDNTISFSANGTGTADEGPTKCDDADPQSKPFTWSFAEQETKLNINGNVITGVENGGQFDIVTLSNTQLILSKDTVFNGIQGAIVANFKH